MVSSIYQLWRVAPSSNLPARRQRAGRFKLSLTHESPPCFLHSRLTFSSDSHGSLGPQARIYLEYIPPIAPVQSTLRVQVRRLLMGFHNSTPPSPENARRDGESCDELTTGTGNDV